MGTFRIKWFHKKDDCSEQYRLVQMEYCVQERIPFLRFFKRWKTIAKFDRLEDAVLFVPASAIKNGTYNGTGSNLTYALVRH